MSLNCAEIDKILEELDLEGSYIQKVVQSSYSVMALHLYKTRPMSLIICLEPGACRLHETSRKIPKFDKPLRFMELLRSRLRGAKITEAVQLNNDRIVRLSLETASGMLYLYIRLWSGAANMLLVDNGIIVDAFYRRPSRHEVSGEPWQPLPQEHLTAGTVETEAPDKPIKTYIVRSYDTSKTFNEAIDEWYARQAPVLSLEALRAEAERFYGLKIEKILAGRYAETSRRFTLGKSLPDFAGRLFCRIGRLRCGQPDYPYCARSEKNRARKCRRLL